MADNSFPMVPPPELVAQWMAEIWHEGTPVRVAASDLHIATQAARWGSDQELEACCEWLEQNCGRWDLPAALRAARRPQPPSLKEQALKALDDISIASFEQDAANTIRHALEQLDD